AVASRQPSAEAIPVLSDEDFAWDSAAQAIATAAITVMDERRRICRSVICPRSERKAQKQGESQSSHSNAGFRDRPRLQSLRDGHVEKFLDQPEAGVVHMRQHERTRTRGEHKELGVRARQDRKSFV